MKKLMIAAAVAAMGAGAFAGDCAPVAEDVARVYQMQLNVYTTKGVALDGIGASACAPGDCVPMRGRDKTVIRGYVYVCGNPCEMKDYQDAFCDSRRHVLFNEGVDTPNLAWTFVNAIGSGARDAEAAWTFAGTVTYPGFGDSTYALTGAGYGQFNGEMFNNLSGYFAGTVDNTYALSAKAGSAVTCCKPSMVVKCDADQVWVEAPEGSVAFGAWKMKFNANVSKALAAGKWDALAAIKKAMK